MATIKTALDFTRLSEKGQVVIPSEVRRKMKLKEGTRFVVVGLDDTILLRKVDLTQERMRLRRILAESRSKTEELGFTDREIGRIIDLSRKEHRFSK